MHTKDPHKPQILNQPVITHVSLHFLPSVGLILREDLSNALMGKWPTDKPTRVKPQSKSPFADRGQLYKFKHKCPTASDLEKRFTVNGGYNVQHRVGISISWSFEWTVPLLQMLTPSPNKLSYCSYVYDNHVYESSIYANVHILNITSQQ